ncbi:DUF7365 family protein [Streptococcus iniae]|uniref:DUF7365 family protein n=1 Tax=Streptococcus iniae TaxID=1346 RepID=UPI0003348027|nr:hypothetical protein [Streptococcus iniae]AGM99857.1 hypothetical protein K710_2115 [Streptococcus iniae SF1]ASL35751.1 phage protein [Streptococcus iniae]QBX16795.1 holin [Streptococcus phage Javan275]QBX25793.1 holin [Streptococcus phage Javan272]
MTDFIYSAVGFGVGIMTIYNMFNSKSIKQATDITLLQSEVEHLKVDARQLNRRMETVEQQNQTLQVLSEQIKNLTSDINEIKSTLKGK